MAWGSLSKLARPRSFGKVGSQIAEGVGGAIGRSTDEVVDGHRLMGGKFSVPSNVLHNQVISRATSAKTSATSKSNQVFVGNRHPGLSPGVEDFTGLEVPQGSLEWMGGGKQEWLNYQFLNEGTKKNPKFITYEELVAKWQAAPEGSKKNSLKKKIDGYKSGMATPWPKDPEDIIRYQVQNELALTAELKRTNPELYSPQLHKSAEFHHLSMKEIDGDFFAHAEQLVRDGKATVIDLINLHNLNKKYGIESGSRAGAALPMQRGPHNWMHKGRTIPLGLEPKSYAEGSRTFGKTPLAKMKKPPKILEGISDADWGKIKSSGANTLDDVEYIQNWAKKIGYPKAIKKWKVAKAKGKIYTPDGKSEIQRMISEFKSIDNIAELTEWRKGYLENVVLPMQKEANLTEAFAKKMSPMDLHRSNQWGKNKMADELEGLRLKEKTLQHKESLESWPPQAVTENPEYEELIGDVI